MCLKVDTNVEPLKPNKEGFCEAWKVIQLNNNAVYHRNFKYIIGKNAISDWEEEQCALLKDNNYVDFALHLFLEKKDAKKELRGCNLNRIPTKLIKVYYKPEDVIAYGFFNKVKSVAVKKLIVKSLRPIL